MLSAVELAKNDLKLAGARLDIFGPDDGECHKRIISMIDSYGLGDVVTLHSPVMGENKRSELLDADIFIQTSRTEGMSVGLLEALASGLPVIVTKGTGMGEFVIKYDAGYVADCSSESIANAIRTAIADKENFPAKSRGAIQLISDNFSWDSIAPECVRRYRSLIDQQIRD